MFQLSHEREEAERRELIQKMMLDGTPKDKKSDKKDADESPRVSGVSKTNHRRKTYFGGHFFQKEAYIPGYTVPYRNQDTRGQQWSWFLCADKLEIGLW